MSKVRFLKGLPSKNKLGDAKRGLVIKWRRTLQHKPPSMTKNGSVASDDALIDILLILDYFEA
ncbi:hypothetical protein N7533_009520 [Penicillium manginii]|uniref:uncharacterized protein n=1 Tax=Penicillium manginii TaxID=203109 RepID=UPI0025477184|nr:uncharacterized protein N7533_009520 [Penicillium manginii]KAJ5744650.1 hypothetical protein N7533_009520 [Penicillium manginii]